MGFVQVMNFFLVILVNSSYRKNSSVIRWVTIGFIVLKTLDVSSSNLLFSLKIPDNKSLCIVHFQLGYTNEGVICQINWSFVGGNQKTDI